MLVTLLTAPPPALSRDALADLSQATPPTFEGIPPLTRHHEPAGVRVLVEPALEGFSGQGIDGALWVTEGALSFFSSASTTGLLIPYPHITLHAISRQPAPTPASLSNGATSVSAEAAQGGPCIYCQIEESGNPEDDDDGEDGEGAGTREMWITPSDPESVDKIFSALSYCASLHPPSGSSSSAQNPSSSGPSILSESAAAGDAALFASMGLDPASMVYATADGGIAGPGAQALLAGDADGNGDEGQWDDVDEGEGGAGAEAGEESSAGRVRSEFVNEGRARGAPY
ncbi:Voldacs domain-containing protein [Rhodotorula paludigena]|uniref:Voldacs domain-containing protein n=1 Tax=Rhodotorula paludigena TaxID=86838 RepID=UPI0031731D19